VGHEPLVAVVVGERLGADDEEHSPTRVPTAGLFRTYKDPDFLVLNFLITV